MYDAPNANACTLEAGRDPMRALASTAFVLVTTVNAVTSPAVVQAPDSPIRLERVKLLNVTPGEPPVLLYAATNLTDQDFEQFTVIAFIFGERGRLKARQGAPGRRTLEAHGTKYSTLVLDGSPIEPTDTIVVGVNQAQRVNSETWWRVDLQAAAEEIVKQK
jgi:hypothetical protein